MWVFVAGRDPGVAQGGETGVTGGKQPRENGGESVRSTARMDKILGIDTENDTITVEAGCVLENVQRAAQEVNRLFPLSLAAQGSCQIEIGRATSELQSLMRISYAVFCLKKQI